MPIAKIDDYVWLNRCRSQSQDLLLSVYAYSCEEPEIVQKTWLSFSLFYGAAFSLWRAVFLAVEKIGKPSSGTAQGLGPYVQTKLQADAFFATLIRDNAATFPLDSESRDWTVGYYLNSALHRLYWLRERHREVFVGQQSETIEKLWNYSLGVDGHTEHLAPMNRWEELHKASCVFLDQFKANPVPILEYWRERAQA